ncbi:MAG: serine hydrolase [Oryzomonas sp.]|uniref:serine hydrolase domain-containing protein n=1 Tax=Oryzomonas sp. TaxID=2855186 RepID=UPI00284805C0|nr:serine hydrolase domain-containing protein [Oryzomonas sp.]MDR3581616.1 serine hydrolase [Oryzomonas sp.]
MRLIYGFIAICLIFPASIIFASDDAQVYEHVATINYLMERAISNNLIAGGVVVIGDHSGILSSTARGRLNANPDAPLLDEQTMFDLASLTKVIATTPAVMKLLDEGKISLTDPLSRWFPEFKGSERESITILNLLTHTSGLADFDMSTDQAMETAIRKAASEKSPQRVNGFKYADINFILLGELVHRVSGRTLNAFCHDELYAPLVVPETMFLPTPDLANRIAPTLGGTSGTVQDRNARCLGSVAGHAGLFSSARDLARFARLMLDGGEIDGKRILSEQAVKQMTSPLSCGSGTVVRGLGWDMNSPFSAPKGRLFSEASFGHTGYSGSSIWIDPKQDLFVILLTTRLNYQDVRSFNRLRRDISTIAVAEFRQPGNLQQLAALVTAPPEISRIPARPHLTAHRSIRVASHRIRMVAALSEAHTKSHRQYGKKSGKHHHHKSHSLTHRA